MTRVSLILAGVLALNAVFAIGQAAEKARAERPPNIIMIVADDLGYGDLGAFGGTMLRTPHLDALAADGAKLTSFYVTTPSCTPTRGALMTGRYPLRNGLTGLLWPEDTYGLAREETTLAELLRRRGYRTALVGKWHLGHQPGMLPLDRGFDRWFGLPYPNDMDGNHPRSVRMKLNWPPLPLHRDHERIEQPVDLETLTQRFTKEVVGFIRAQPVDQPFFLMYATHAPHAYLAASPAFRGRSAGGLYGDMVEEFDGSVGELRKALREAGHAEQTLIVFTNDNGAVVSVPERREMEAVLNPSNTWGSNRPFRGGKNTPYEGGVRVPAIAVWPGRIPAGRVVETPAIVMDVFVTLAAAAGVEPAGDRVYDGQNLLPLLAGTGARRPTPFFFGNDVIDAVRDGDWRLVLKRTPGRPAAEVGNPELYHLSTDPDESDNVAAAHPDVVARLLALRDAFMNETRRR